MAERKKTLRRLFGSLINNAVAVEGAKYSAWWIGLILFIFGLLLPIVPIFVNNARATGTSFLRSFEYGLGLDKTFGKAINDLDGLLTYNRDTNEIKYVANSTYSSSEPQLIGGYVSESGNNVNQYELRIYYNDLVGNENEMKEFIITKEALAYEKGTTNVAVSTSENIYIPSSIYFFPNAFYVDIFAANSIDKKAEMGFTTDMTRYEGPSDLKSYFVGTSFSQANEEDRINALNNLKTLIDDTYKTTRKNSLIFGTLIYFGVYFGVNFFMALMIFLMSRGKNNPNNYLNLWHCIKIDWWACLAPGILGLILGFIFPTNATMFYILFLAMRMVWLSTKELRPQY